MYYSISQFNRKSSLHTHVKFPPHHSETVTQVKSQISKCVKNGIFEKLSHKMLQMNEREFDTRHFYHGKKFLFPR